MIIARAPVRISFGGGGTDLAAYYKSHDGFVLSTAITRYCTVIVEKTADSSIRISSADYHLWEQYPAGQRLSAEAPLALPKAVLAWFQERGYLRDGINLFLASEVAPGSGLGSSSAMTVALISALAAYCERQMTTEESAELACFLEIERLQMPIGKQDQYASTYGGLNTLTFTADDVQVTPVELPAGTVAALNERLLLFTAGQVRNSADILRQQSKDTEQKTQTIETLHRLKALAEEMQKALMAAELDQFGQLLHRGWQEKKGLSQKISSQAIDHWYTAAREAGAVGGKITGAGGGGFLLLYCPLPQQENVRSEMKKLGLYEMPFEFDFTGARIVT